LLECVVNVSEGRDVPVLTAIRDAAGAAVLDVHHDPHHNRAVFTLAGTDVEMAARHLTEAAIAHLDLRRHEGVHPRFGVVDVVPYVPLEGSTMDEAIAARDRFATWAGAALALPCFLYGAERTLPEVRRRAFATLPPDTGPRSPHPSAGACAVGARPVLVAYNVWLGGSDLATAREIAATLRSADVRALGLQVGDAVQVSCNLLAPDIVGPAAVYDRVAAVAPVRRAELVGLAPLSVIRAVARDRWEQLDLGEDRTIEERVRR